MRRMLVSLILASAAAVALYTADNSKTAKQQEEKMPVANSSMIKVRLVGTDGKPTEVQEVARVVKSDA